MPMTISSRPGAGGADQFVHRDDQRLAAFEREALLADVAGMQVALQRLGSGSGVEIWPKGGVLGRP
jgi:hypothetical protein